MSTWQVQVAVMDVLNRDAELPPVYDPAEPKGAYPYGTWSEPTFVRRGALNNEIRGSMTIGIDWWGAASAGDRVIGNAEVAAAALRARSLLDGNRIALSSGRVVSLRWESDTYVGDPDPNVRHLQQRFRVGVKENRPPVASFVLRATNLLVEVDATLSSDPDGGVLTYAWDWGDGTAAGVGVVASHEYAAAGDYIITLTVTDPAGATGTASQTVTVTAPVIVQGTPFSISVDGAEVFRGSSTFEPTLVSIDQLHRDWLTEIGVPIGNTPGEETWTADDSTRIWLDLPFSVRNGVGGEFANTLMSASEGSFGFHPAYIGNRIWGDLWLPAWGAKDRNIGTDYDRRGEIVTIRIAPQGDHRIRMGQRDTTAAGMVYRAAFSWYAGDTDWYDFILFLSPGEIRWYVSRVTVDKTMATSMIGRDSAGALVLASLHEPFIWNPADGPAIWTIRIP